MRDRKHRPWWEDVVVVGETLGAFLACALIVTCPLWGTVLLALLGLPGLIMFPVLAAAFVLAPSVVKVRDQPALDAYRRWGTNMGRLLRAPIVLVEARRRSRELKSLGASTSASSTAAPSSAASRDR
ncbi:MAG: hypothetical protein Q8O67_10010 [Deltaproteobacteria bacterium]|nr:hypothetical protein [Deltaproteobacteria bacterium]